jgi:uncharacterized protein YndB with AHSA1/START domain
MTDPAITDPADSVTVSAYTKASPDRAFQVFTAEIGSWWNPGHHVLPGPHKAMGVDPYVGGRLWDENLAGEICVWGRVLVWQPGEVFAFAWLVGTDWTIQQPDTPASRVTVTFSPEDGGSRVTLVHDEISAHGPGWEGIMAGVGSPGGWPAGLTTFAEVADRPVPAAKAGIAP